LSAFAISANVCTKRNFMLGYKYIFMLKPTEKSKIISAHRLHDKDTGSAETQVALFSEEISRLAKHLKKHQKDNSSRLGLLKMVAKRKRLLDYLKREAPKRYEALAKKIGLAK